MLPFRLYSAAPGSSVQLPACVLTVSDSLHSHLSSLLTVSKSPESSVQSLLPMGCFGVNSSVLASNSNRKEGYSKYHINPPCSNCFLCGKLSPLYSHYAGWGEDEKEIFRQQYVVEQEPSACPIRKRQNVLTHQGTHQNGPNLSL